MPSSQSRDHALGPSSTCRRNLSKWHCCQRLIHYFTAKREYHYALDSYVFNVLVNGLNEFIGATHYTEVAFVFHNVNGNGYDTSSADPFANKPESYKRLATLMSRTWVSFIVDQTPNESGVTQLEWPVYTSDDSQLIVFDANVTELAYVEPDTYRAEEIAYIQELYRSS